MKRPSRAHDDSPQNYKGHKNTYGICIVFFVPFAPLWRIRTMSLIRIGILTVSDRASQGVYEDRGGPAIRDCLGEILSCPWEAVPRVIPDEQAVIEATL